MLAQAPPTWLPPAEKDRCPSKWGAGDERGSGNHQKPAAVMKAVSLIKTGEVIELAHVLNDKMPFFGTRRFDVHVKRTFMNPPSNQRGSNEELVVSEIGQVGTQFDGFAHQTPRGQPLQLLQDRRDLGRAAASPSSASSRPACSSRAAC